MAGPFDGIRVIDLTTIYSGPICASILGDQGADVIKVESPTGDWIRGALNVQRNGVGGSFAMMNRNKRSIVIDLSQDAGKDVLRTLVKNADLVIENYRPGVMERLGIGYEALKQINPKLVFASINGMGASGPYANRRVYDAIVQSVSGIAALQADPHEERPVMVNSLMCDKLTSMTAAQAISAALFARERTGVGQRVDIAMLEAALFFIWPDNMLNHTFVGDDVPFYPPLTHTNFVRKTADGYVCTMPVQEAEWKGLFNALQLPNLLEDERFLKDDGIDNDAIQAEINRAFERFETTIIMPALEENQVPFAKINARDEVVTDPQVIAMEALIEFEHPFAGPMRQARPPARFSATPAGIFRCSPELGEHTQEVLLEAGFEKDAIKALKTAQVIR